MSQVLTSRQKHREATYDDIVRASREVLAETGELSLRAVAGRIGMTAPALYRYVDSYQELVDLVAFDIDKAATAECAEAADAFADDDHAGRLVAMSTEFRMWALANPREFGLAFANPIADARCIRREMLTMSSSGHLMTGEMRALWEQTHHPIPAVADLPAAVQEAVAEPLIPAKVDDLPLADRGLVWVYMQAWTTLYGVVALEVFGHMDPRIIESGEMFIDVVRGFAPRIGLTDDADRLEEIIRERLAR